jgi:hypothetical protein
VTGEPNSKPKMVIIKWPGSNWAAYIKYPDESFYYAEGPTTGIAINRLSSKILPKRNKAMNYHDPSRTRLANWRPCWLDSHIALPPFQLEPHPTDPSMVCLTICHGARGIWLEKDIPLTDLHKIFHYWSEDPEGTFTSIFGLNDWPRHIPQTSHIPPVKRVAERIEDLI